MAKPAPHVAQAIVRGARAVLPKARTATPAPAAHVRACLEQVRAPIQRQAAVQRQEDADAARQEAFAKLDAARGISSDFVVYRDLKSGGAPPPPPRRPIFALGCDPHGGACSLRDVKTGREREADDFWGGFVRMAKGGAVYVSPRAGVGAPGDSHPTIASGTPEGMAGVKSVVAAGEIGIRSGEIVGHNDKTGHFQSRKNRRQSGLPADRYHPFTEDPHEWYK